MLKKLRSLAIIILVVSFMLSGCQSKPQTSMTPVETHGQLSVKDTSIQDEHGNIVQLRGIGTHGIQWYPDYVNKQAFIDLQKDWKANVVRLAMYTDDNSQYSWKKDDLEKLVRQGIDYAIEAGIYVIVDWHILTDGDPNKHKDDAIRFFKEIATKYKSSPNIIYELCNEPNGSNVTWDKQIKPYAEELIKTIRAIDNDSIIIVGTSTWSQDIHIAAQNPLKGDNIMYAMHFYANTHTDWLRNRMVDCITRYKLPIFVTEFGTCDASGNTGYNEKQSEIWLKLLNENNVSWVNWSLCNKNETSAVIKADCFKYSGWVDSDLSESGLYVKSKLLEADKN